MDNDTYAIHIRSMIKHENILENNRLTWLLVSQGFLFAAVGVALESNVHILFIRICSIAGLLISVSAGLHLKHARRAMNDLLVDFKTKVPKYNGPPVIGLDMEKNISASERYLIPPYFLPCVFIGVWIAIFLCAKSLVLPSP